MTTWSPAMSAKAEASGADASLNWRESSDPRKECCQFDFSGRRYIAHRIAGTTEIIKLSKRERTNRGGVQYRPLSMKGKAARLVLDFIECPKPRVAPSAGRISRPIGAAFLKKFTDNALASAEMGFGFPSSTNGS